MTTLRDLLFRRPLVWKVVLSVFLFGLFTWFTVSEVPDMTTESKTIAPMYALMMAAGFAVTLVPDHVASRLRPMRKMFRWAVKLSVAFVIGLGGLNTGLNWLNNDAPGHPYTVLSYVIFYVGVVAVNISIYSSRPRL